MAESKIERALSAQPGGSRREDFQKPGQWASELMSQALIAWEDQRRLIETQAAYIASLPLNQSRRISQADVRELSKWRSLRKLILAQGNPNSPEWHYSDFSADPSSTAKTFGLHYPELKGRERVEVDELVVKSLMQDYSFPSAILEWSRSSRKIFSISKRMMETFENADYSKTAWQNIPLPFRAFAIELPEPLEFSGRESVGYIEAVIVADMVFEGKNMIMMLPIVTTEKNKTQETYSSTLRSILDDRNRSRKHALRAFSAVMQVTEDLSKEKKALVGLGVNSIHLEESIERSDDNEAINRLRKIVAGMSAYLVSGSATSVSHERPVSDSSRLPVIQEGITNPDEVFLIGNAGASVTSDEGGAAESIQRYLAQRSSPKRHPVRKHFRRPPGSAPDAPKTVEVKAQWRGKAPPEGELPIVNPRKVD